MVDIRKILSGAEYIGKTLTLSGWVKSHQAHGAVSFIQLNDGSTFRNLQIIHRGPLETIPTGSSIKVSGKIKKSIAEGQDIELASEDIEVLKKSIDFPIQKKEHTFEFLRENAHLRHRTSIFSAVTRIKHKTALAVHKFFDDQGFFWIQAPIITGNNCEGGAEVFEIENAVKFFKKKALLSVSGQFHAEAISQGSGKVYTFGPTFRAEKSNSSNHLAEFWMIEGEMAFHRLEDNANLIESFIKSVTSHVLSECKEELELLQEKINDNGNLVAKLKNVVNEDFVRIQYEEAIEIIKKGGIEVEFGDDLNSSQERFITAQFNRPVFVFNYPKKIKAFYMKEIDGRVVGSLDLLVPDIGELVGGSEREGDINTLRRKIEEMNIPIDESIDWYLKLRDYGYHTSSGFGVGYERLILYLTGLRNIKDAIAFPRSYENLSH